MKNLLEIVDFMYGDIREAFVQLVNEANNFPRSQFIQFFQYEDEPIPLGLLTSEQQTFLPKLLTLFDSSGQDIIEKCALNESAIQAIELADALGLYGNLEKHFEEKYLLGLEEIYRFQANQIRMMIRDHSHLLVDDEGESTMNLQNLFETMYNGLKEFDEDGYHRPEFVYMSISSYPEYSLHDKNGGQAYVGIDPNDAIISMTSKSDGKSNRDTIDINSLPDYISQQTFESMVNVLSYSKTRDAEIEFRIVVSRTLRDITLRPNIPDINRVSQSYRSVDLELEIKYFRTVLFKNEIELNPQGTINQRIIYNDGTKERQLDLPLDSPNLFK